MKYIDAEKLKTVLASHYREITVPVITDQGGIESYFRRAEIHNILNIITSLQQEQPDNEDIDKVAQELYEHLYELKRRNNVPTNLYDKKEIIDLWKAGIEYGRNHPNKEQPEVDLENYISNKLRELGADLINHKPYSFNRGLNVGETNAYHDILNRLNARKEE